MQKNVGTLYVKTGCGYCKRVLDMAEKLDITFTLKNVADDESLAELIIAGGKKQEPYFIDAETGIGMYEADLINAYLQSHYGDGKGVEILESKPMLCDLSDSSE